MSKVISNVRNLRKRGKTKLVRISDQMNDLAWELSEKNDKVNDSHTAKSIAMLDESLALMQRALGLLNSVSIDPDMLVEDEKPVAKKAEKKGGLFSKGSKADNVTEDAMPIAAPADRAAPIASLKPQG